MADVHNNNSLHACSSLQVEVCREGWIVSYLGRLNASEVPELITCGECWVSFVLPLVVLSPFHFNERKREQEDQQHKGQVYQDTISHVKQTAEQFIEFI